MAYSPSWLPWLPEENKKGGIEWHCFGEAGEDRWEQWLQEKGCGQRRDMGQVRTRKGILWGGFNGQEELAWLQLTLTLLLDLS